MTLEAVGAVAGSVLTGNLGAGVHKGRVLGWSLAGALASFIPFVWRLWRPGFVVSWLGSALTIGAVGLLALAVTALAGTRGGRALLAED